MFRSITILYIVTITMAELLNDKIRKSYDIIAQAIELQFEYSGLTIFATVHWTFVIISLFRFIADNKEVDPYVNLVEDLCDIEQIVINHTSIMHKLEANDSEPMSLHIAKVCTEYVPFWN